MKHHSDTTAQLDHIKLGIMNVPAIDLDLAGNAAFGNGVVHAIETAQKCRLAATRWPNERRDSPIRNVQVNIEQGLLLTIEDRHLTTCDFVVVHRRFRLA